MSLTPTASMPATWRDRAIAGDDVSFQAIVERHQSMVYSIAWHALGNDAAAEEVAQDVFLRLYRNLEAIESEDHLKFWLRRVTTNRVIDETRKRRHVMVSLDDVPELVDERPAGDPLLGKRLRELVRTLPMPQRLVVTLRYQEELVPKEIARVLEMPLNTVRSHLRRALAALREALEDVMEGSES